jgi:hypothetical protein
VVSVQLFDVFDVVSNGCADSARFTGPKITLGEDTLTEEQQEALKIEGLEIKVEPQSANGTQVASISKDVEKA